MQSWGIMHLRLGGYYHRELPVPPLGLLAEYEVAYNILKVAARIINTKRLEAFPQLHEE